MQRQIILALLLVVITLSNLSAQNNYGKVSGKILTKDGKPAEGIAITILNTRFGAASQADGTYFLKVTPGKYTIQYKALGMTTKEVYVNVLKDQVTKIEDVVLELNSFQLKDVVVTGQYAPQSLKNS